MDAAGPLDGIRVLEFAGQGPGPFAAMMLADMGAEVIRVDRDDEQEADGGVEAPRNPMLRGRRSIVLDLKRAEAVAVLLRMLPSIDAVIEGYRPGVMERLGLGPEVCAKANPKLVYGRVTGWGQSGPMAHAAGHDINYIALAGALDPIGRRGGPPVPPLNLLGDYASGGMYLAFGLVSALLEAQRSGRGQVVDAAMVDGAAHLTTTLRWKLESRTWNLPRGTNMLDGGSHFYGVYETSDHKHVAIGAIEPRFYAELRRILGLEDPEWGRQLDQQMWPELTAKLASVFRTGTREHWCTRFAGAEACFTPVLDLVEAPAHPHHQSRGTFVERFGVTQPIPTPRLSRTPGRLRRPPPTPGQHSGALLGEAGFSTEEIAALRQKGAIR
ncbi:CaiB/BaiF CoA transferase family protein [Tomitella biformata]|uniref:CaiB/BaiF CoA transferase family protein n=1 Tax=Tomitella biformata TaxID=630403 RepID=UPI000463FE82|nr:CaiB/BaiF CoA-transferase family protein [Tomitella biformata]